jgi:hypothetical protein
MPFGSDAWRFSPASMNLAHSINPHFSANSAAVNPLLLQILKKVNYKNY